MSVFGLQNIAKQVNLYGYKTWLNKYNEYLNLEILGKGSNDIAKFVAPALIETLIYCKKEWWCYNTTTRLWKEIDEPSATIINFIQNKITESQECELSILNANVDNLTSEEKTAKRSRINEYNKFYKDVCNSAFNSQVNKFLKTYLEDDDFHNKLDRGLYKMVFQNGILDLTNLVFQDTIKQSDFITKTIPFDYKLPTEEEIAFVKEALKKICNYNDKHLEYYLSSIGYAFTGDSEKEQNFWYLRGETASNGKSLIFEVLEKIMPNYVIKAKSDVLDKGSDLRKEIDSWRGLKILWLNEVSTRRKDEDVVKAIADGTSYKYDRLYTKTSVNMPISFKLFAVSNNTLTIKGDEGVKRRFKLEQFNSQFKDEYDCDYEKLEFKKDKELNGKLCGSYKNALVHLFVTYSMQYFQEKKLKDYPIEWDDEAKDVIKQNNKFDEWFFDTFDIGMEKSIFKKDFDMAFKNCPDQSVKIRDELKKLKIPFEYRSQEVVSVNGEKQKGWWYGFTLKGEEE
jgi:hypothetical protein